MSSPTAAVATKRGAFDIRALPSFSHSLDRFPSMAVVDPAMLHWGGCQPTRAANQQKFAQVLERASIGLASSSDEEDDAPLRRLRMTPVHATFPPTTTDRVMRGDARQMPPLKSRSSASSASSTEPPTPSDLPAPEPYFPTACSTPRTHRSSSRSPRSPRSPRRSLSRSRRAGSLPRADAATAASSRPCSIFNVHPGADSDDEGEADVDGEP